MRAAIYVRVSFGDGRQTVENQEQQLAEGYTPFDIVDEQFRICAGRRGSCAVSSVPERRVRLRYVHPLRCGHAPVSIEMVAITIPSSVRSQPAPWHRRPCTGTLAETPACCSVARAPGIFPADEDRSRR
jgi:hypothetical protein